MIFNRLRLAAELESLTKSHRVIFAASCSNRLLPNYRVFADQEHWGDVDLLNSALNYVWEGLEGDTVSLNEFARLKAECEAVLPKSEDFNTELTTWAQNAGIAVSHTLQCCIDGSSVEAAWAANAAFETVDDYIREAEKIPSSDPSLAQKVDRHPLMVRELEQQQKDLSVLKNNIELTTETIIRIRHSWSNGGRSNINLG